MDLLEYQAKELFNEMGIPVLPSQRIDHPKDLKGLKIPYPVVLKSQVYTGGRGKAGGIRFVANTIDAVAAAQAIFNLPIVGQYPEVLLAEAKYESDRELYLAIAISQSTRRPVLLGSQVGGIDLESVIQQMQQVVVDQEFSLFYARRLALKMGLTGQLIESVSQLLEKMYRLFVQNDLDLVEINPLAVSPAGELMALDGKIIVNDAALGRHADLAALQPKTIGHQNRVTIAASSGLHLLELEGVIATLCSGMGLALATLDLVTAAGGKVANLLNVGDESQFNALASSLPERVAQGLELMLQGRGIKAVLINVLTNTISCRQIATVVANYVERRAYGHSVPPMVVRLVGKELEQAREILAAVDVPLVQSLDEAIAQVVLLSQSRT
ncbi:succinate--CoA ligase subunit beta [Oscillatoria sp. FACHB-1407]|uniref:succinate--CoA ligase subunit beta n=1 Tax=Oscillatoria sp. FACHB-1407 TaxID=2692847 RepID=UPI0016881387|nr:succinate--CoA ligase subunit beta [Oscillatoria sp. FACHB-1407]MBD2459931.1 succinate--CoA ligase subunit beta [Oscillatoria sp. FACHB-1407]